MIKETAPLTDQTQCCILHHFDRNLIENDILINAIATLYIALTRSCIVIKHQEAVRRSYK